MRKIKPYFVLICLMTLLFSCKESTFHEGKLFAGGVYATADQSMTVNQFIWTIA